MDATDPCLVIYIVDPFTYGQEWEDLRRLAMLGILRLFHDMVQALPEHLRQNTQLQIVPQKSIVDSQPGAATSQALKALCLSVYTQNCRLLKYTLTGTSLTGFGPSASAEQLLKQSDSAVSGPASVLCLMNTQIMLINK